MTIVLIIAVSVVLIVYIVKKSNKEEKRPWATKEAHDRYLEERDARRKALEKEKESIWEEAYAPHKSKDCDNEYSNVAKELFGILNYPQKYLTVLTALQKTKNIKLKLSTLDKSQLGDMTHLYVKNYNHNETDLFDYLEVENSDMGIWQAYLLYNISSILPLWWHALPMAITYIFSYKDIKRPEVLNALSDYQNSLSPNIINKGDHYIITYCFWNDHSGLIRSTVKGLIVDGTPQFKVINNETLFHYNCGIEY